MYPSAIIGRTVLLVDQSTAGRRPPPPPSPEQQDGFFVVRRLRSPRRGRRRPGAGAGRRRPRGPGDRPGARLGPIRRPLPSVHGRHTIVAHPRPVASNCDARGGIDDGRALLRGIARAVLRRHARARDEDRGIVHRPRRRPRVVVVVVVVPVRGQGEDLDGILVHVRVRVRPASSPRSGMARHGGIVDDKSRLSIRDAVATRDRRGDRRGGLRAARTSGHRGRRDAEAPGGTGVRGGGDERLRERVRDRRVGEGAVRASSRLRPLLRRPPRRRRRRRLASRQIRRDSRALLGIHGPEQRDDGGRREVAVVEEVRRGVPRGGRVDLLARGVAAVRRRCRPRGAVRVRRRRVGAMESPPVGALYLLTRGSTDGDQGLSLYVMAYATLSFAGWVCQVRCSRLHNRNI